MRYLYQDQTLSFEELKLRAVNNAIMGLEGNISPDLVNP